MPSTIQRHIRERDLAAAAAREAILAAATRDDCTFARYVSAFRATRN